MALSLELIPASPLSGTNLSMSIGFGNAHIVIAIAEAQILLGAIDALAAAERVSTANWVTIGKFGSYDATLYIGRDEIQIVVDGDPCGDGSNQSFGLHMPRDSRGELVSAICRELDRLKVAKGAT